MARRWRCCDEVEHKWSSRDTDNWKDVGPIKLHLSSEKNLFPSLAGKMEYKVRILFTSDWTNLFLRQQEIDVRTIATLLQKKRSSPLKKEGARPVRIQGQQPSPNLIFSLLPPSPILTLSRTPKQQTRSAAATTKATQQHCHLCLSECLWAEDILASSSSFLPSIVHHRSHA